MDFPIQTASTIRMGLSIICFKGTQVDFCNKYVLQSLKIALFIANSADPDEMQITKLPFRGFIPNAIDFEPKKGPAPHPPPPP